MKAYLKRTVAVFHDSIKRNSLKLFKHTKKKTTTKASQHMKDLKNNVSLFGRLYIANQLRDGDPEIFFSRKNHLYPPALSDQGKIRFEQNRTS